MLHVGVDELLEAEVALVGQVGVQAPVRYPPADSMSMTNTRRKITTHYQWRPGV